MFTKAEKKLAPVIVDLSKYIEAGFDAIWQVFIPPGDKSKWIAGFYCQGPESSLNDGLVCYLPCYGEPEQIRLQHLSPTCSSIQEAIDKAYNLYQREKSKYDRFFRKIRRCKEGI